MQDSKGSSRSAESFLDVKNIRDYDIRIYSVPAMCDRDIHAQKMEIFAMLHQIFADSIQDAMFSEVH